MATQTTLRDLQRWISWVVTEPIGVNTALESPEQCSRPEPGKRLLGSIVEQPPLPREKRLDVYAEAYYERLLEMLESDFPTIKRVLGEELFRGLVAEYLDLHPSTSFTGAVLGARFPDFLAGHERSDELPYLSDLARLEWALASSFFAPDSVPLDAAILAELTPEQWPLVRLELAAGTVLLHSRWNIDRMNANATECAESAERWLLIYRKNMLMRVAPLDELQFLALSRFSEGQTLEEVCETLESRLDRDAELPPIMDWFRFWLDAGVITEVVLK